MPTTSRKILISSAGEAGYVLRFLLLRWKRKPAKIVKNFLEVQWLDVLARKHSAEMGFHLPGETNLWIFSVSTATRVHLRERSVRRPVPKRIQTEELLLRLDAGWQTGEI